jgi:ABC-2 type transport system ATP-binding protein
MSDDRIVLRGVSKFYGDVLGVNRVDLDIGPGLTGLVGPNGSGKSTLMHLITGLLRPSRGHVDVLGVPTDRPERLFRLVGYCTQYDAFPPGITGRAFLRQTLRLHGVPPREADARAVEALARVDLAAAGGRRVAGYSKGMRQRIKLAHAMLHDPQVLILDEPLNGLDPVGRAEVMDTVVGLARQGRHVIVSSHILHEVDAVADSVVMIHGGAVVAEGEIRAVRGELTRHPIQILVRCRDPRRVATLVFALEHVVEVRMLDTDDGLLIRTRDANALFGALTHLLVEAGVDVETVAPADESVHAVYDYLIGGTGGTA